MKIYILICLLITYFEGQSQTWIDSTKIFETTENFNFRAEKEDSKFASVFKNENNESFLKSNGAVDYYKLNNQFDKYNFKAFEKKLDYNQMMTSCGVPQNVESKDLMISAFKYYILNKYVFSLFSKTEYN